MENATTREEEYSGHVAKRLSSEEMDKMRHQNSRLVTEFRANQIEKETRKNWDLFYKRNDTRFFKDRHWTTREFRELLELGTPDTDKIMMEVGCGVGNLIYPLLEDGLRYKKIYACDLSPRAIDFVKNHRLYDCDFVKAFQSDVTLENCFSEIDEPVDLVTLVFVLSAIHPEKFQRPLEFNKFKEILISIEITQSYCLTKGINVLIRHEAVWHHPGRQRVAKNIFRVTQNNGILLFRDYGLYDMAQLRFKAGHKISENFYMRQDGTRSYYFSIDEVRDIFESVGFETTNCSYVERRTVNFKEKVDAQRIFVQGKFKKP